MVEVYVQVVGVFDRPASNDLTDLVDAHTHGNGIVFVTCKVTTCAIGKYWVWRWSWCGRSGRVPATTPAGTDAQSQCPMNVLLADHVITLLVAACAGIRVGRNAWSSYVEGLLVNE